jgi:lysophospholipase L1-like esterase
MKPRSKTWFLLSAAGLLAALGLLALYLHGAATGPPANSPEAFLAQGARTGARVVVCLGDSLTHGRVSYNYVDELARRHGQAMSLVNAGVNSQLAWHLRQRLDQTIACRPSHVIILVGANDALGSLGGRAAAYYHGLWRLPQDPDPAWFRDNLEAMVDRLRRETQARIALLSLPPLTEDPQHPAYRQARLFSGIIKEVAERQGAVYLPLFESMERTLAGRTRHADSESFHGHERGAMYGAILRHYLLGQDWNTISRANGFLLLVDFIHLNERGGHMVADLADDFLR